MSYYYKYNFISPEPTFAIVKEELKSYFDTGAVDDLMFPTYLHKCLEKLGRATHAIVPVMLYIEDFTCRLPDNFYAVREAWMCTETGKTPYTHGSAFYSQGCDITTIELSPLTVGGACPPFACSNPICKDTSCGGHCMTSIVPAVFKSQFHVPRESITRKFLLKPGNISFNSDCNYNYNNDSNLYGNYSASGNPESMASGKFDSFDLRDNKFVTTFRSGIVELLMYASDYDTIGNQMIPDNYRVKEFIEAFLKQKVFETLMNQINDETSKQIYEKYNLYKSMADEAYTMAEIEIKKQDAVTKMRRIKKLKDKFNMYNLPGAKGIYRARNRNY